MVLYTQCCPACPIHHTEVVVELNPKLDILKATVFNEVLEVLQAVVQSGVSAEFLQVESMVHLHCHLRQHSKHANVDLGSLEGINVFIVFTYCHDLMGGRITQRY